MRWPGVRVPPHLPFLSPMTELTGNCQHCGKEHTWNKNSTGKYCSNQCQADAQFAEKVRLWLEEGVVSQHSKVMRRYLLSINDRCWECGIQDWCGKPITLELEHSDGNPYNNSVDNLKLLCPNCHSQTPTYKNKNMGNGRVARRERAKKDYHRASVA